VTTAPWMTRAWPELGVRETRGAAHTARVLEYHRATTLRATTDEVPWCSSFVNWVLAGPLDSPWPSARVATRSAAARSWLAWGRPLAEPAYGAIVVLSRGTNPAQGHVGFLVGLDAFALALLGGNQGDAVSVVRHARSRLVGMRWPLA
jgi:uncharacterized protein (TIGR02594 family)